MLRREKIRSSNELNRLNNNKNFLKSFNYKGFSLPEYVKHLVGKFGEKFHDDIIIYTSSHWFDFLIL